MNKRELISTLREVRQAWDGALDEIGRERMEEPGAAGRWSVKDIAGHVAWTDGQTAGMLRARGLVGSGLWRLPEEERNAAVYELNRARPLDEILADSEKAYGELLAAVDEIPEKELLAADWFAALLGDFPPWRVVVVNVTDHYAHHVRDLRRWIEKRDRDESREWRTVVGGRLLLA